MSMRASGYIKAGLLATIPFLLLAGVWTWKQSDAASGPSEPARPSVAIATAEPTPSVQANTSDAKTAAEYVLRLYLANPSPASQQALEALRPLVSDTLYQRFADEWEGSTTRAVPRLESTRSVTLSELTDGTGFKYNAEAIQTVDFPAGEDEINTLSVTMRLKQSESSWIVFELDVI